MLIVRRNNGSNWLSRWFDDNFFDTELVSRTNGTAPAVNVKETTEKYIMEVAVPGLQKEWAHLDIDNEGNLNVAIENKMEHKKEHKGEERHAHYLRREFSYSNYEQTYELPDNADRDKIEAKVADGVLTIVIPKILKEEEKKTKKIEVK